MSNILPGKKRKKGEYFVDGSPKFEVAPIETLRKTIPDNFIEDGYGIMEGKKELWSEVKKRIMKERK